MRDSYIEITKEIFREDIYKDYDVDDIDGRCSFNTANKEEDKILLTIDINILREKGFDV